MSRSPVQQYLITLARAWARGSHEPVAPPEDLDANALRAALLAHNVDATVSALLPDALLDDRFREQIAASRTRTDDLLLECERILPLISRHAHRPVLLKGAALALHTYADPAHRWFLDLDLLVPRAAVAGVCQELQQAGYRPLPNGRDPRFYEKYHLHRVLLGPAGACVEIHWNLTLPGSVYHLSAAGLTARSRPEPLGRLPLWRPVPVDQILHAVYQNIADGYLDLRRVFDLALLVPALSPAETVMLADLARRAGLERALALSLHIVKFVADVEAAWAEPPEKVFGASGWRVIQGLDVVGACLDRRAHADPGYTALLHLLTTPRSGQRLREAARWLWVGEERLLDMGHRAGALPGLRGRTRVGLHQTLMLARMGGMVVRAWAVPRPRTGNELHRA